ncbi:hypothetical protein D3C81_1935050 [compost metagenome]
MDVRHFRGFAHLFQQLIFPFFVQIVFQFKRGVEMVLDRPFAFPRHDNDILDAGSDRFLHDILNRRLVDDRQHLFGHRLRCWQETRP